MVKIYFFLEVWYLKFIPLPFPWNSNPALYALSSKFPTAMCIVLQTFTIFINLRKIKIIQRYNTVSYIRKIENINKVMILLFLWLFKHSQFWALYFSKDVVFQFKEAANWKFFVQVLSFCSILFFQRYAKMDNILPSFVFNCSASISCSDIILLLFSFSYFDARK